MVARGADYRVRWSEQLRQSHSLMDLAESALSCDEDSFDSLIDEQISRSQGIDNSSEGDRSSEAAELTASGGNPKRSPHAHARSTPALEQLTGKRGARRVQSLTDLHIVVDRLAFTARGTRHSATVNAADVRKRSLALDSTHPLLLSNGRRRSRQHSIYSWHQRSEPIHFSVDRQHFRKKSSTATKTRLDAWSSSRYSAQSEGCTSPALAIPDDLPALLRAVEERDRQIASACHEKARLLEEYRKLQLRSHLREQPSEPARDSVFSNSSGEHSANTTPVSSNAAAAAATGAQAAELRVSVNEELVSNVISFLASRRQPTEAAAGDRTEELSVSQVLELILALNAQLNKLLVRFSYNIKIINDLIILIRIIHFIITQYFKCNKRLAAY